LIKIVLGDHRALTAKMRGVWNRYKTN